jgi:hypothetical protein
MTASNDETQGTRAQLLERFPVFAELPSARVDEVLAEAQLRRVPAGGVMFEADMPCVGFPLVLEGSVRVAKLAPTGREIVLYRVAPGEGCILAGRATTRPARSPKATSRCWSFRRRCSRR